RAGHHHATRELRQLAGESPIEPIDPGDAVAHLDDAPRLLQVDLGLEPLKLALDDLADLLGLDHVLSPCQALAHARELPVESAVDNEAAHLGDEAPEQLRVHRLLEDDLPAEYPLESRAELRLLVGAERDRTPDLST